MKCFLAILANNVCLKKIFSQILYITLIFAYKPFNSPFLMRGEGEVNKKHSAYVQR